MTAHGVESFRGSPATRRFTPDAAVDSVRPPRA
jgi:hypothetical protein